MEGLLPTRRDQPIHDAFDISKYFASGYSQGAIALVREPLVSRFVVFLCLASVMGFAVDLDGHPRLNASEIQNVRAGWVLATKFES